MCANDLVYAFIEIKEASSSALGQLDVAVHEGCLKKQLPIKESHDAQLEARILKITNPVTKEASIPSDYRVRLAKEEERREAQEESKAGMAKLANLVREAVISGLRDLGVVAVKILKYRIVAATNQIPGSQDGSTSSRAAVVVKKLEIF